MYERIFNAGGYVGIALIQGATLPSLARFALGYRTELPPLSMVVMVWAGLALFLARSIHARQWLYIWSEGIGFALQALMFAAIVLPHH